VYQETAWHFVSKERFGEVCVLLYEVHRLQSCAILSNVKLLTCLLLLSVYCFFFKSGLLEIVFSSKFLLLLHRPTGCLFLSSTWNVFLFVCCESSGISSYYSMSHFQNVRWYNKWHKFLSVYVQKRGYTVAQLVVALRYKLESRGFDSRWCHWNFSLT